MRRLALVVGPLCFVATLLIPSPAGLGPAAWHVAGLAAWMATWWLTAVLPLQATSLLPIVVLPLTDAGSIGQVTARYADPIIFLFLGGFFMAATLERWNLHKRFALATVRAVGTDAPRVVLAFMLASAIASMWISNTATTLMMLPIAMAVVAGSRSQPDARSERPPFQSPGESGLADGFPTALMLGVAYAASIGGVATLIGTPPNAIMAGAARDLLGVEITFGSWMGIGLLVTVPMLAGCWLLLVLMYRVRGPVSGLSTHLDKQERSLGPPSGAERFVLTVFGLTAAAWILRSPKTIGPIRIPGLTDILPSISDPAIAIAAALVLFAIPLRGGQFSVALDWESARKVPWGILLLFGGGLALASAFERTGLTEALGGLLRGLEGAPGILVVLATATLFVLLTELTSNAATTALGMPLVIGVAQGIGLPPLLLVITAALAASMAFMLPVATPPNAIVFGSGTITTTQMMRAGIGLNILAVAIITLVVWLRVA